MRVEKAVTRGSGCGSRAAAPAASVRDSAEGRSARRLTRLGAPMERE